MMLLLTVLNIDSQMAYNGIMIFITAGGFILMYNKSIKSRADKKDVSDLKKYVDQQDRSINHRVDGIEKRLDENIKELNKDVKDILKLLRQ